MVANLRVKVVKGYQDAAPDLLATSGDESQRRSI